MATAADTTSPKSKRKTPAKKVAQKPIRKAAKPRARKPRTVKKLALTSEGILVEHPFKKAPSYFWVAPDARVVLAGVALSWVFIFGVVVSAGIVELAATAHQPLVSLQSQYVPADSPKSMVQEMAQSAAAVLAVPQYSNTFSPVVPFGPMLNPFAPTESNI